VRARSFDVGRRGAGIGIALIRNNKPLIALVVFFGVYHSIAHASFTYSQTIHTKSSNMADRPWMFVVEMVGRISCRNRYTGELVDGIPPIDLKQDIYYNCHRMAVCMDRMELYVVVCNRAGGEEEVTYDTWIVVYNISDASEIRRFRIPEESHLIGMYRNDMFICAENMIYVIDTEYGNVMHSTMFPMSPERARHGMCCIDTRSGLMCVGEHIMRLSDMTFVDLCWVLRNGHRNIYTSDLSIVHRRAQPSAEMYFGGKHPCRKIDFTQGAENVSATLAGLVGSELYVRIIENGERHRVDVYSTETGLRVRSILANMPLADVVLVSYYAQEGSHSW